MLFSYHDSKKILDKLVKNKVFLEAARDLVSIKSLDSAEFSQVFASLKAQTQGLRRGARVVIISNGGEYLFSNNETVQEIRNRDNHNGRAEIMTAVNYAWGNRADPKYYEKQFRDLVAKGYGLAERKSKTTQEREQYIAKTIKQNPHDPLIGGERVFTLRVSQIKYSPIE